MIRHSLAEKHGSTYPVFMKNLTIALDEAVLREARRIAAERGTSVNALIRTHLEELIAQESRAAQARRRVVELCSGLEGQVGRPGSRNRLHDR